MVAVEEVPWEHVSRYGRGGAKDWKDNSFSITGMVEKPRTREDAPSNLIISGRYILQRKFSPKSRNRSPVQARDPVSPTP